MPGAIRKRRIGGQIKPQILHSGTDMSGGDHRPVRIQHNQLIFERLENLIKRRIVRRSGRLSSQW